jgi:predicted Zn-dependent peptidase
VKIVRFAGNLLWILAAGLSLRAQDVKDSEKQDLKSIEKKVSEFSLANGLHFIVMERHAAPVASFHTYVNAGSMNDPAGESGMARLVERLAFKGTDAIGTRNWAEEKKAMDAIEDGYDRMEAEANKGAKADQSRVEMLRTQVKLAMENARRSVNPGEYLQTFKDNGSTEPVARTTPAATEFSFTLPSNRTEIWFLMESQRMLRPVFRDFYGEREAEREEFREHYVGSPQTRLLLELLATAFKVYPYRNPPTGWPSELMSLRRSQAKAFFERYYAPGNITIAICGDVDPAEIKRMADRYFGPMVARPAPPPVRAEEPSQDGPRTVVVESTAAPVLAVAYKRPDLNDRDDAAFDVLQLMLAQGPTAYLPSNLVEGKHVAASIQAIATFPDGKGPNLFLFLLNPAPGHTVEENQQALEDALQRFKAAPIDAQAVERAKAVGRAGLLRTMAGNGAMATLLAMHHVIYGDWRKVFTNLEELNKVSADQITRVAERYFVPTGRTIAYSVAPGQSDPVRPPVAKPVTPRKTGQVQ